MKKTIGIITVISVLLTGEALCVTNADLIEVPATQVKISNTISDGPAVIGTPNKFETSTDTITLNLSNDTVEVGKEISYELIDDIDITKTHILKKVEGYSKVTASDEGLVEIDSSKKTIKGLKEGNVEITYTVCTDWGEIYTSTKTLTVLPSNVDSSSSVDSQSGDFVKVGNVSEWAKAEVTNAQNSKLVPHRFENSDLSTSATRAEFAAIAVKLYESISGEVVSLPANNPFTDTSDEDVLKAYALGITNGTSDTTFSPNGIINREQMATMMTRVFKLLNINTETSDSSKFDDASEISSWAKESVNFMASKGIILGVGKIEGKGDNCFSSKSTATREQALIISNRILNSLSDK